MEQDLIISKNKLPYFFLLIPARSMLATWTEDGKPKISIFTPNSKQNYTEVNL